MSASKPMTSDELLWAIRVDTTKDLFSLYGKIDEDGLLIKILDLLFKNVKQQVRHADFKQDTIRLNR